jgi:cytochrome b561
MNTRGIGIQKQGWIPKKERLWVIVAIMIAVPLVLWELKGLFQLPYVTLHSREFEHTFKDYGSNARIALFFVLAYYVLLRVIRIRKLNGLGNVKKSLSSLLRFARRWHTPVALIAIAFIILHTVAVFMHGFKFDFNNISGLLAVLVLLPVPAFYFSV